MFDFILDLDNYEERKIDRYEDGNTIISTAKVSDAVKPYETAVSHKSYNGNNWVIVEDYYDPAEAQQGHNRWVKTMTSDSLPEQLTDIMTSGAARLALALDPDSNIKKRS